jgi:hypothetical protein
MRTLPARPRTLISASPSTRVAPRGRKCAPHYLGGNVHVHVHVHVHGRWLRTSNNPDPRPCASLIR